MIASGITKRCVRSALRSNAMPTAPSTSSLARQVGARASVGRRAISSSSVRMHGSHNDDHGHDHDHDFVAIGNKARVPVTHASATPSALHDHGHDHGHDHDHDHDHAHAHDHDHDSDDDSDDEDMVDTVAVGPSGIEYGGPQRGGQFKEPTRFGDWERKGRCTDF